jgi:hypothetical protein
LSAWTSRWRRRNTGGILPKPCPTGDGGLIPAVEMPAREKPLKTLLFFHPSHG